MEEEYYNDNKYVTRRSHVPAFGSWDCADNLPFTQCFESATVKQQQQQQQQEAQTGEGLFAGYSYSDQLAGKEDQDLYVAGDLYDHNVVTPAMIVVPRSRPSRGDRARYGGKKGVEKQQAWSGTACDDEVKQPPSPPPPRAVDEDLYKISPDVLRLGPQKKRGGRGCFFSSCLMPICDL